MGLNYIIPKEIDNAEGQLNSSISAGTLTIPLVAAQGALFPQTYGGSATSLGDAITLNSTGIGANPIVAGDFIENITDGSHAFVVSISTNQVITTTLQGGSGNIWHNADVYRVNRFIVTLNKRNASTGVITQSEKVLIDSRSTDILTAASGGRGYDGSTAATFSSSDYVNIFVHSRALIEMRKAFADLSQQMDLKASTTYVNTALALINWKQAVRCASTGAGTLASSFANGQVLDGQTLATGDRILLKDQASGAENGIYIVAASGAPTRATDFDASAEIAEAVIPVSVGTTNADNIFVCVTDNPTVGVTALVFTQLNQALSKASTGQAQAGADDVNYMTALKTAQAIIALGGIRNHNYTYGASINGTTTPQAVYVSDGTNSNTAGRIYLADADDSTNEARNFAGFCQENITSGNVGHVAKGIVGGFSTLTVGVYYWLSATPGAITATNPGGGTVAEVCVGKAISATEIDTDQFPGGWQFITSTTGIAAPAKAGGTTTNTSPGIARFAIIADSSNKGSVTISRIGATSAGDANGYSNATNDAVGFSVSWSGNTLTITNQSQAGTSANIGTLSVYYYR